MNTSNVKMHHFTTNVKMRDVSYSNIVIYFKSNVNKHLLLINNFLIAFILFSSCIVSNVL